MNAPAESSSNSSSNSVSNPAASAVAARDIISLMARWVLGGIFIYMGLTKALHPVDFLKILREYHLIDSHVLLNLVAAGLPWFEIVCGLLLLAGVAVRGAALLLLAMLIPFSLAVLNRALAIHAAKSIAFCAIRFDCGCGAGEVIICRKLLENTLLILSSGFLLFIRSPRWCLRHDLW